MNNNTHGVRQKTTQEYRDPQFYVPLQSQQQAIDFLQPVMIDRRGVGALSRVLITTLMYPMGVPSP